MFYIEHNHAATKYIHIYISIYVRKGEVVCLVKRSAKA